MLMRLPFSGQIDFSVIQRNSVLYSQGYMGTISAPLVQEQQNPKVCRKSTWTLAMSKDHAEMPTGHQVAKNTFGIQINLHQNSKPKQPVSEYRSVISSPNDVIM